MEITFEKVTHWYQAGTPFASQALQDVSLTIKDGSFTAIIGHTGSGKSTLIQHLNALLKPTSGRVVVGNEVITSETSNKHLKPLRKQVGMVFQFPENQLFEETVLKDIAFGPQNFGVSAQEATQTAVEMAHLVGLNDDLLARSPFDLSGGQMRRVAIAGVLASNPTVLVLDEPTAGLDPQGRLEIMNLVTQLHEQRHMTVVLITHQMDDVAKYAEDVIVMDHGRMVKQAAPAALFNDVSWLREHQLQLPTSARLATELTTDGFTFSEVPLTADALAKQLAPQLKQTGGGGLE